MVAEVDVKPGWRLWPKVMESLKSPVLLNKPLNLIYLEVRVEGLCIILVVYILALARICLKALDACSVSTPISLKFMRLRIRELSDGITKRCAGDTTESSARVW